MKVPTIAFAAAFALSGSFALAQAAYAKPVAKAYNYASVMLMPNNGNPNGNADGPTTLSGTGASTFGGSSAGTSGRN